MDNPEKLAILGSQDKTKTNKPRNTIQYVLDAIIYKTHGENKLNKKQYNMWWMPSYTRHTAKTN